LVRLLLKEKRKTEQRMMSTIRPQTEPRTDRPVKSAKEGSDHLSGPLADACARVRQLFSRNDARDALDRYAIGCIIRDVRDDEPLYGQHSVGKLARSIGRDVDTLYEYADVAQTWSEVEIARLLERKTPLGLPLSFTHLVVLSKIRHRRDLLKDMTDRALTGISSRHLRGIIDEFRRGKQSAEAPDAQALAFLKKVVNCCEDLLAASRSFDETLADVQSLTATPKLAALLEQAKDRHLELKRLCQENSQRLEEAWARVRSDLENTIASDEADEPDEAEAALQSAEH
jgi:hypothetical protein